MKILGISTQTNTQNIEWPDQDFDPDKAVDLRALIEGQYAYYSSQKEGEYPTSITIIITFDKPKI